jgi:hypothetical protein
MGLADNSCVVSDFNVCGEARHRWNDCKVNYFFEIEIGGKINGIGIKPKSYYGLVLGQFEKTETGSSYGMGIQKVTSRQWKRILKLEKKESPKQFDRSHISKDKDFVEALIKASQSAHKQKTTAKQE